MTQQATAEQNAAYRQGLCIGLCGQPYSAGRPRCTDCHAKRNDNEEVH